ncbi:MAG: cytochrome c oxidase subunit I [bacterium]
MEQVMHAQDPPGAAGGHIHPVPKNWIRRWVFSTDHKVIGLQYLFQTLFFLFFGGFLAMLMRWQLAYPGQPIPIIGPLLFPHNDPVGSISPENYIMILTMHGTIMVFFVIAPILVGAFGNFLIPLMIGARDMAFPFLNMLSYWFFFLSGVILVAGFGVEGGAAAAGWTAYPPLSAIKDAVPGSLHGQDIWLLALTLFAISSLMGAINFLATIINMRAPGLTWMRLPLFVWAEFIVALLLLLAFPVATAAFIMMISDRFMGTSIFLPLGNVIGDVPSTIGTGRALLWQHLFWFLSHPEVYVLVLPGMGIASEILPTFSRKPIFGYVSMVGAMVAIGFLGFIVWAHHMFQTGMNPLMDMAFMTSTMLIALPSGIKVFNWLATIWRGTIHLKTPMLFGLGFVGMFIIGGLSGLFMASTPVDIHIHDTFFIVAHFHYVVFAGTMLAVFGGLTYWFPKMYGRMMNDFWGKVHFWLTFVALNCVFFPMHYLGAAGHMRRIADPYQYDFLKPLLGVNTFISMAAFTLGAVQIIFVINYFGSMLFGPKAAKNPWDANTLEWQTTSPAPHHNFDVIPLVLHGPYEYGNPNGNGKDWISQNEPAVLTSPGH